MCWIVLPSSNCYSVHKETRERFLSNASRSMALSSSTNLERSSKKAM